MNDSLIIIYFLIFVSVLLFISTYYKYLNNKNSRRAESTLIQPMAFRFARGLTNSLYLHNVGSYGSNLRKAALRSRLYEAGLEHTVVPSDFILLKNVLLMLSILISALLYVIFSPKVPIAVALLLSIYWAYVYPDLWLRKKIKVRREQFSQLFPFMLDLLVLLIRSGLTFTGSIDHAVKKLPPGPVKSEFSTVLFDIRTGLSRKEALNNMAGRLKLLAVTNFVSIVNQVEETGGELGNVLSVQAKQRRAERFNRAEKLANQAAVKMLGPLIGLLFPITLTLILFPVFIKTKHSGALNILF